MRNPFKIPQYLELVAEKLEEARKDYLHHSSLREYHCAMEQMLVKRIERLTNEIKQAESL
jgi:hypothetical protein